MTRLLVSVRDVAEAHSALAGGADLIDIKEPANGPLGRADSAIIESIVRAVADRVPVSAALGELQPGPMPLPAGLSFAKFGLAGWRDRDWPSAWDSIRLSHDCRKVAVAYADWQSCDAPPPEQVAAHAVEQRFGAFLIDTFEKKGATLLDVLSIETIADLTHRCRSAGVPVALAGSLGISEIDRLRSVEPDWFAVRGAACKGGRTGKVDEQRVRELNRVINELAPLADSGRGVTTT